MGWTGVGAAVRRSCALFDESVPTSRRNTQHRPTEFVKHCASRALARSSCIVMLAALLANAAVSCAIIFSARYYLGSAQVLAVINSTRGTASQIWHWIRRAAP